jgi:DNA-binding NtrC family response regulator
MPSQKYGSILVVDDQENWRNLLTEILTSDGHIVKTAANVQEAENALQESSFDIATIDMRLVDEKNGNVDGLRVLKKAKELHPNLKAIILTGYPDNEQKAKALNYYKVDGYYEKVPHGQALDIDEFSRLIFKLLAQQD